MKIGFVLDDSLDKSDGVQQYIVTLGTWLTGEGHDVHYLVGHTERDDIPHVHNLGRTVHVRFNKNRMSTPLPARVSAIRELLARERFDVLHVQMPYSPFLAARVVMNAPATTRIVGTFHILPVSRLAAAATRVLGVVLRQSLGRFDAIVSVSQPAADFARRTFGIASQVVPNAVTVKRFARPAVRRSDRLRVVYLGRLVERKGCMQFLQALVHLNNDRSRAGVEVLVAGKGPLMAKLQAFAEHVGLEKQVTFLGFVAEDDKPDLLASADIAVFPSLGGESFGIVLVEAMAAGSDVVLAGNNPGYASVMGEHHDQLIDPLDTEAFAATLAYFIDNPSARKAARAWQIKAVPTYDVATVGRQLLAVYQRPG